MRGVCQKISETVPSDEALAILDVYVIALRESFEPFAPRIKEVRFEIDPEMHDSARHFAGYVDNTKKILAAPQLVELPRETVMAILAHEFGHATDFLYPGIFCLDDGELIKMPDAGDVDALDKRGRQALQARMRWWRDRDTDTVERTADAIGEHVIQQPIGYSGPCMLQTLNAGVRPRPGGLR